ncbi:hypothetical protein RIF29_40208 [Crotalaria pallida]|uniref:Uncharacterized protein n=1 Tax=Crotalaria pallida TaxID=3830 RepID=A0AAN9E2S1_CROPI
MGRAPCCEKMGLKKGPWTSEEDQILINYINAHGHANWRALPKLAGLLRCGKSCRLRWINYLRPDIKRGNFTKEEEDAIIDLHEMLGNRWRWSAIAARLPGRTDNEIKNVWHTHLKKRLPQNSNDSKQKPKPKPQTQTKSNQEDATTKQEATKDDSTSSSDMSTLTNVTSSDNDNNNNIIESMENDLALDEEFWSEVLSSDNSNATSSDYFQIPLMTEEGSHLTTSSSMCDDSMEFWFDVYARAGDLTTELLEL